VVGNATTHKCVGEVSNLPTSKFIGVRTTEKRVRGYRKREGGWKEGRKETAFRDGWREL
jgi:hypothetical protein